MISEILLKLDEYNIAHQEGLLQVGYGKIPVVLIPDKSLAIAHRIPTYIRVYQYDNSYKSESYGDYFPNNCDYFYANIISKSFKELHVSYFSERFFLIKSKKLYYFVDNVFNEDVYNLVYQCLKGDCPIAIVYDWLLDNYPKLFEE